MLRSKASNNAKIFLLQNSPRIISKQIWAWTNECEANLGFHAAKLIDWIAIHVHSDLFHTCFYPHTVNANTV